MAVYLLDTNIITPLLKRQGDVSTRVKEKLQEVLKNNAVIIISPLVYYEHARGLYHAKAGKQLHMLNQFMARCKWCDLDKITWDIGAQLWAKCRAKGTPTGEGIDKDVLIAAQAQQHGAIVVTSDERHYQYLGATIEKW